MADETPAGTPDAGTQETGTSQTTGDATGTNGGQDAKPVEAPSYFKTFRSEKEYQDDLKARIQRAEAKGQAEAEAKALVEQGKWKELYEKQQTQLTEAQTKARELELSQQRRDVAAKVGLPAGLADRLRGESPEEMEADAKSVLAALPKPPVPNINNGAGGEKGGSNGFDEAERVRLASIYGVSAKHFGLTNG